MSDSAVAGGDHSAVFAVPERIIKAWANNDADMFAETFTEDGSLILPGVHLTSREEIRAYMTAAYAGPFRGTRVFGEPIGVKYLGDTAAIVVTRGGVLAPGDEEVAPERAIRATWVLSKQDKEWLITSYQNTPANK